jgi:hypothetical protein
MRLIDIASEIKREAELAQKAATDEERKAATRLRRVSYYKQFGDQWFSELSKQIEMFATSFNEIAGDLTKLSARLVSDPGSFSILVSMEPQNSGILATSPYCLLTQEHDDLKVTMKLCDGPRVANFQCEVRIADYQEFKVQVMLKRETSVIDEAATDRYCNVDDEHFFPIFKTVKSEERKLLASSDFAEFVLSHFVEFARKKH